MNSLTVDEVVADEEDQIQDEEDQVEEIKDEEDQDEEDRGEEDQDEEHQVEEDAIAVKEEEVAVVVVVEVISKPNEEECNQKDDQNGSISLAQSLLGTATIPYLPA